MSTPSALRRPDDTAPSLRGAPGFLCPTCRKRFDPPPSASLQQCPDDGSALVLLRDFAEAEGDPMLGRTLDGRFTVLARLGAGSMGTVYRARQHPVGRDVAIKILRSDRAIDEVSRARFLREARANSALASPNTVTVFDFGQEENGDFYLAMELLEGESLGQRLKRVGRLSVDVAIETARQALRSLSEAHSKGIIHRDLKPDNLFYAHMPDGGPNDEVVKVLDFGIAKMLRDPSEPLNAIETQAGTVFGTPRYMSPEQAQAKSLDARSDLYSLGVILYHMLAGRPPYLDDDAIVVMARHIKSPVRSFADVCPEANISPEIERVVMRALAKEPSGRPENAEAMSNELVRALEGELASSSGVRMSTSHRRLSTPPVGFQSPLVPPSSPPARVPSVRVIAAPPVSSRSELASLSSSPRLSMPSSAEVSDTLEVDSHPPGARRGRGVLVAVASFSIVVALCSGAFYFYRGGAVAQRTPAAAPTTQAPSPAASPKLATATTTASKPASVPPTFAVETLPVAPPAVTTTTTPSAPARERGGRAAPAAKVPSRAASQAASPPSQTPKNPAPAGSTSNYGLFE